MSLLQAITGSRLVRLAADAAFARAANWRTAQLDALNAGKFQEAMLLRFLRKAQETRFGKDHDFHQLRTVADYQARVPIRDYDQFWNGYWKDAYPNLDNITWPGKFPYYALSSGTTTGATKYIPVSREMVKSNQKAAFTTMALFRNAYPKHRTFTGKFFFLGGCTDLRTQADGSLAGDLSGIAAKELVSAARPYAYPPLDVSLIPDWQKKFAILAEQSPREPITAVSGVPSWMLTLFQKVKETTGKKSLIEVWPELKLIIHGGTKFDSFRNTFKAEIGSDDVKFCEVYPCSEGFIATEDPRYNLLRIVPDHDIFFEFVPMEYFAEGMLKTDRPTRHTLANVETGVVYAVVITNCSGVWSYLVGDTVSFESRNPPLIRFTGRTKNFLSAFGEHLIEEEIEKAIAKAASEMGTLTTDHHVGPVFPLDPKQPGFHQYVIEFQNPPANLDRFEQILDGELRKLNEDYDAHRIGDLTMLAPRVRAVPAGTFEKWMASRGKQGGQNKVPRMDNTGTMTANIMTWLERQ